MFGLVSVKKEMGKTVNSHKKSREKLKKFKETVFETQNTNNYHKLEEEKEEEIKKKKKHRKLFV